MASGSTPTYLLPYPLPTDPVNVASDIEELADRLEIVFGTTASLTAANTFTNTNIFSVNSASTAVRITQVGSGNALLVEDEANPDTSAFVVTNAGDVGIGKLSPGEKLDVAGNIKLTGNLIFEGASEDNHELSIVYTNPTVDRTITLPDVTGTVITTGNLTDITSTGTIASGTWNGSTIGANHGGTGLSTYVTGDILYSSATNVLSALAIGTNGYVLTVSGGLPSWQPAAPVVSEATQTVAGAVLGITRSSSTNEWLGTALGYRALALEPVSGPSIATGYSASIAIGSDALSTQIFDDGVDNIAIGYWALKLLTNGYSNTVIGNFAADSITTGSENTIIGYATGESLTAAFGNVAIGIDSLANSTGGDYNVAVGYSALDGGGSGGSHNIAIGYYSGQAGTGNITIGRESGLNVVGQDNIGIGQYALNWNGVSLSGSANVALGSSALYNTSGGSIGNTAIGVSAGNVLQVDQNYNTFLGLNAGALAPYYGENNIIIGYNAQASASTVSNEITIGNANITRLRIPGLGINWTTANVPSGSGGGDAKPQIFMLMGA
jgi:hypothetical protein